MMDDKRDYIILAITIVIIIASALIADVAGPHTHKDCVCLERSLHFNGIIWCSTCSKWEHHHKEYE